MDIKDNMEIRDFIELVLLESGYVQELEKRKHHRI